MPTTRRDILGGLAAMPLLTALPWRTALAAAGPGVSARAVSMDGLHRYGDGKAVRPLRILVLGGSTFVGPATIRYALDRGHEVAMFNRGLTNAALFPGVTRLRGDRLQPDGGLAALADGEWDAVIDTWQGEPSAVADSLRLLAGRYGRYAYVSSIAVYGRQNYRLPQVTEEATLPEAGPEHPARRRNAQGELNYSIRKLDADRSVQASAGERAIVIRPHAISGRYAVPESENQLYWPIRMREGGDVLAPGDGDDYMQYIDVADLGRFVVRACEQQLSGVYNACRRVRFSEFLGGLAALAPAAQARLHWASWEFLQPQGIHPFAQLPLWVPRQLDPGFNNHRDERAVAAGLRYRPFADTWREMLACADEFLPAGHRWGIDGDRMLLTRERERELLGLLGQSAG